MFDLKKLSCAEFSNYFFKNGYDKTCELTLNALKSSKLFLNDNWMSWYIVENNGYLIAIIGVSSNNGDEITHISIFEVVQMMRGCGLGTLILKDFIRNECKGDVTLYAEQKNEKFYEFIGFEHDGSKKSTSYIFRKEKQK